MKKNNKDEKITETTEKTKIEKKEIDSQTSVRAIINGYVAYGIICLFIFFFISVIINLIFSNTHTITIAVTVSIIEAIFIFFALHGLCRLSTYDVFKKCKTKLENINIISKKMIVFFLIVIICSVICSATSLFVKLDSLYKDIQLSSIQYKQVFTEGFTNKLINEMIVDYNHERQYTMLSTLILEFGFAISVFSLIPYQKKVLNAYNKYE